MPDLDQDKSRLEPGNPILRQVINSMPDSVFFKDLQCRYLGCNEAYARFIGRSENEIIGLTVTDFYDGPAAQQLMASDEAVLQSGRPRRIEVWTSQPDGSDVLLETTKSPLFDNSGQIIGLLGVIRDITKQREAEKRLAESEAQYRLLAENATDVIWVMDLASGHFKYVSPSILQLRGFTVEEALQQTIAESMTAEDMSGLQASTAERLQEFLANPESPKTYIDEIRQPCKNGQLIWVEISSRFRFNAEQQQIEVIGISRDIEARKKRESDILFLSTHDYTTGIFNRSYFESQVRLAMDRTNRYQEPQSMIMFDLDHFKQVNDNYGHLTGDEVLKLIVKIVSKSLRSLDLFARFGGEEFVILMPETSLHGACQAAEKLRHLVESNPHPIAGTVTISCGIAEYQPASTLDDWYRQADDSLYQAKAGGRNCVVAFPIQHNPVLSY